MKRINKTPLAAAMGVAFISTFSTTASNAEANPFGMSELSTGYMQVAEASKAAEMKCGASMAMPKTPEGACAGSKTSGGKTTEAKCGSMMDGDKMKKGMENVCGAMMKGKEGACGAGMKGAEGKCGSQCGDAMKTCESLKTKEGACGAAMKGCGEAMQGCSEMMKGKEGACASSKATPAVPAAPAKK